MGLRAVRIIILFSLFQLLFFLPAKAAQVGRFLEVEGKVDLLKRGQLPAIAIKAGDLLEVEDVVRTKSQSRTLILFVDDTTLAIAPESRVTVNEFSFDAGKSHRRAVLRVVQGLVRAVVPRVLYEDTPTFLMETHTAAMAVRGTEWYAHLLPHATDIYTVTGSLEVRNLNEQILGVVITKALHYTRVNFNLPPTPPTAFSLEDINFLKKQLSPGVGSSSSSEPESSIRFVAGPAALFLRNAAPGFLSDYSFLNLNLLGSFRESNFVDRLSGGISVPPRLSTLIGERDLLPGDNLLDRITRPTLPITIGSRLSPGVGPGTKR